MKKIVFPLFLIACASFILSNCSKEPVATLNGDYVRPSLPDPSYSYTDPSADYLRFPDNTPPDNSVTNAGATLGRVLFYDTKLSLNNRVACVNCHKQEFAFSDNTAFSRGFESRLTPRNSMAIINLKNSNSFFWDMNATELEEQVLLPVRNHIEMGIDDLSHLEVKLTNFDYYPPLFEAAFGTPDITSERISKAMSQFLRSMVSYRSKYDEGIQTGYVNFDEKEMRGMQIFQEKGCANCHSGNNLKATWGGAANIGLDMNYKDKGKGAITGEDFDEGVFAIPSLRNVAVTAPYMHDGRFATLRDVINHYNKGIQPHRNLDWRLIEVNDNNQMAPKKFHLGPDEINAIIAFLGTTTDYELIGDQRFSDPFK